MKKLLTIAALAAALSVRADTEITLTTLSHHLPARADQNNTNIGLAVRTSSGLTFGGYHNTQRRSSLMLGYTHQVTPSWSLMAGTVTGYIHHDRCERENIDTPTICHNDGNALRPFAAIQYSGPKVMGITPKLLLTGDRGQLVINLGIGLALR